MGTTTFTGPVRSGPINNTTGTTLGKDVKNIGYIILEQEVPITQAGTTAAFATNIVLPPNCTIIGIRLYVTTAWTGVAATFNVGTSVAANELAIAADNTAVAIGIVNVSPGANTAKVALWADTGATDVRIWVLSTNTGSGAGFFTVQYAQSPAAS